MSLMWRLALRNVFRQRARTLLTLGAIAAGIAGLILSGGFVEDIYVQLREATIHSRLGHIQISKAGYSTVGRRAPFQYVLEDPETLAKRLAAMPGVVDVLPRLELTGLLSNGKANYTIVGEGVDPEKETRLGSYLSIVAGRQLTAADEYGILVGRGVAHALRLSPGDPVTILLNTPDGSLNSLDMTVVGVFGTYAKDFDDRAVRMPLSAAQELVATPAVHTLVLSLERTKDTKSLAKRVGRELPAGTCEIRTWEELADFYRKTVALYDRQFGVLQLITLFMVLLTVANSVSMTIWERTGEVGTLMALGDAPRVVRRLILAENVLLAGIGGVLGVLLGIVGAIVISKIGIPMPAPPNADEGYTAYIRIVPWVVVKAFLAGVLATIAAAAVPARRASQLPIAEALRQN
jgi:putative ABC transport system permease protein